MDFIRSLFLGAVVTAVCYYALVIPILHSPIPSEYWLNEMIFIKEDIARRNSDTPKILLAGGSSVMFGISAEQAGKELSMPAVNFGLHMNLKLDKVLRLMNRVSNSGDTIIFAMEPTFYVNCDRGIDTWHVAHIIAWDRESWDVMNSLEKAELLLSISPTMFGSMVLAAYYQRFEPAKLAARLATLDRDAVLSRFYARNPPTEFEYAGSNLNDFGDMLVTDGPAKLKADPPDWHNPDGICPRAKAQLKQFLEQAKTKGVTVYFANIPYMNVPGQLQQMLEGEAEFLRDLESIGGCMIDRRNDLIFDKHLFFDTRKHLSAAGRVLRTDKLVRSLQHARSTQLCMQ